MLYAIFRPLIEWPGKKTQYRERSRFDSTYTATLELLERELNMIGAKNVVIQAEFALAQIKNSGWPKSSARPEGPAVILSFQRQKELLSFPCDTFSRYEDNLRAIALSLEALRKVDRYGVSKGTAQYKGFAQLEAATPIEDKRTAAELLQSLTGISADSILGNVSMIGRDAYRAAAALSHPDRQNGTHELFIRVSQAKAALGI